MRCRFFATWGRSCPRLPFILSRMLMIVLVLTALQYAFVIVFRTHKSEPLFSVNAVQYRKLWRYPRGFMNEGGKVHNPSRGFMLPNQLHPNAGDSASHKPMLNTHRSIQSNTIKVIGKNTITTGYLCPTLPRNLSGPIKVLTQSPPLEELENKFPMLNIGGRYSPTECQAIDRVAIIVPYRDRAEHLRTFLLNLHPLLQRQQLDYGIYIVEQAGKDPFNRAMLMNIGFVEASKLYSYDCFIFHDVDLLPENDYNLYTCPKQPRHMSVAVNVFNYKLPYKTIFGGVSAMTKYQFQKVNGFSNMFWGWGGEDDDMSNRVRAHGYHIGRYPANVARYRMLMHLKQSASPKRFDWLKTGYKRLRRDGLNSLRYKVKEVDFYKLFTKILVELQVPANVLS